MWHSRTAAATSQDSRFSGGGSPAAAEGKQPSPLCDIAATTVSISALGPTDESSVAVAEVGSMLEGSLELPAADAGGDGGDGDVGDSGDVRGDGVAGTRVGMAAMRSAVAAR